MSVRPAGGWFGGAQGRPLRSFWGEIVGTESTGGARCRISIEKAGEFQISRVGGSIVVQGGAMGVDTNGK